MGIINLFKRQLSQVIQWENPPADLLWQKFISNNRDEIKNAGRLIVAPGQGCVLVYEGKIVDIVQEGLYNLKTDNHPFITNLIKLRTQFESEHKLALFFYRTTQIPQVIWGTASPLKYFDPIYNMPVELGLNGNYSFKLMHIEQAMQQLFGSAVQFSVQYIQQLINSRINETLSAHIVAAKLPYNEIDGHLPQLSALIKEALNIELADFGIGLTDFKIQGTAFDEATMQRINKIADISSDIQAASQAGLSYAELEKLRALRDLAANESSGNLAAAGMQMGVGLELAKSLQQQIAEPNMDENTAQRLRKLKLLLDENVITEADYLAKKQQILAQL